MMKLGAFGDRLFANCGAELAVFIAGGIPSAAAHWMNHNGGDPYFAGFLTGVSMCAFVLSLASAITKLTRPEPR